MQKKLAAALRDFEQRRPLYELFAHKIASTVSEILLARRLNFQTVTSRAKTVDSVRQKILHKAYDDPLAQMTDLAGVRVIGYVESDLQRIRQAIEASFEVDVGRSLDKSSTLGTNQVGYRSIHLIVSLSAPRATLPEYERFRGLRCEIQIRTVLQHAWAEIEHDRNYKFRGSLPAEIQRRFNLLAGQLEAADREFDSIASAIDVRRESHQRPEVLDERITASRVREYLSGHFRNDHREVTPTLGPDPEQILSELRDFGVNRVSDLADLVRESGSSAAYETRQLTYLGYLRDLMLFADAERYFRDAWKHHWTGLEFATASALEAAGIDISKYMKRHDLELVP